jgi:N-acyl-phosphatidylethanolamine-hydrolysing phospholipase D
MIRGVFLVFVSLVLSGCGSPGPHIEGAPEHHVEGGFRNPSGSPEYDGSLSDTISAYTDRIWEGITGYEPTLSPEYTLAPDQVREGLKRVDGRDALTWLGHASFLIELGGRTILTDPFLSEYATGSPPFGPKRATPPALSVGELPQIDILVVSHNHYDHLDAPTIEALPGREEIHVIVPLGMGTFFTERGYSKVTELDWYEETVVGSVSVTAVPSVHGSGRGLFDRNEVLWAGYVFGDGAKQVYFAGDTAYGPVYPEIGRKMGPVDYALVPIGVYEPRRRMKSRHVDPGEAVRIGRDLQAKTIVGMHWGTIRLSDEAFEEPPRRFRQVANESGFTEETAWVLKIGESRRLN